MPYVTVVVIRHSKSCSNHFRLDSDDTRHQEGSQQIPDSSLSKNGLQMAKDYSSDLQTALRSEGIELDTAYVGGSALRRAQQTAALLFPGKTIHTVPHFTEMGDIPENTPAGGLTHEPSWPSTLRYLASEASKPNGPNQFVIVGHGGYIKTKVWPSVSKTPADYVDNMDAFVIRAFLTRSGLLQKPTVQKIPYAGRIRVDDPGDTCTVPRHLAYLHKKPSRVRKQSQYRVSMVRRQKGGMPLASFQDGAQMRGTLAEETGVGLSNSMVRSQLGGARKRYTQKRSQKGGFTASVMGGFAINGVRLLPIAGYTAYKMYSRDRTRKRHR